MGQVMDDRWEAGIMEFGAINITGFRIVDTERRYVKDFIEGWKRLDTLSSLGAGKEAISVRLKTHTISVAIYWYISYPSIAHILNVSLLKFFCYILLKKIMI